MLERNDGSFSSSGIPSGSFAIETANESTAPTDYMGDKFIAQRAYQYWEQRGRPFGSPEIDWLKAIDNIHLEMTFASGSDIRLIRE